MQHSAEGMKGALWQPQWRLNASEWNQLLAALATALVLVLPICLNVPLYQDDFERAVNGMYYWAGDGRPLSEFVARLLALGAPQLALTSPLGTLLCVPAMAFSAILFCRLLRHRRSWGGGASHGVVVWLALFHREPFVLI